MLKQMTDVWAMAVSPDGGTILAATGTTIACWSGQMSPHAIAFVGVFQKHSGPVHCLAISTDGRHALSGGDDKVVHLWDVSTQVSIRSFEGHTAKVTAVAISRDRHEAVSGGEDGIIRLWRLPD